MNENLKKKPTEAYLKRQLELAFIQAEHVKDTTSQERILSYVRDLVRRLDNRYKV